MQEILHIKKEINMNNKNKENTLLILEYIDAIEKIILQKIILY